MHVSDGVDVHHQGDEGNHQHHGGSQAIDQETDVERVGIASQPGVHRAVERMARHHILEDKDGRGKKPYRHREW